MSARLIQMACGEATPLLKLTEAHHAAYCKRHGIEYQTSWTDEAQGRHPVWNKVLLIQQAIEDGCNPIIWLDADCLIVREEPDIACALHRGYIGMVSNQHNGDPWHLNAGAIWCGPKTVALWKMVWDGYEDHPWQEQHVLNKILDDHRLGLTEILHPRWNCNEAVNPVPNPIVRAWHGIGSFSERLGKMEAAMAELP